MTKLVLLVTLALAACGGAKSPAPSEAAPPITETAPTEALAPEACTAQGGEVRGDIGDGKIACAEGEQELGRVAQGIEGAICCKRPAP